MIIKNYCIATYDAYCSLLEEYKNDNNNDTALLIGPYGMNIHINDLKAKLNVSKIIIFNFEVYSNDLFFINSFDYIYLLKRADEVWDYDEENIKNLKYIRKDIKLHNNGLKPFIKIPQQEKIIDVLMYGSANTRRIKIYEKLVLLGINIVFLGYNNDSVWQEDLNDYIAKSKILLNIHYYEEALQEQARMCRWLGNGVILSEKSQHNYLNVIECEYNDIVPTIFKMLQNYNEYKKYYNLD